MYSSECMSSRQGRQNEHQTSAADVFLKISEIDIPRPISSALFSGLRIAPGTTNTFLDTSCDAVSEKNTSISNELTNFEKSSIERLFGHQKIGANA